MKDEPRDSEAPEQMARRWGTRLGHKPQAMRRVSINAATLGILAVNASCSDAARDARPSACAAAVTVGMRAAAPPPPSAPAAPAAITRATSARSTRAAAVARVVFICCGMVVRPVAVVSRLVGAF
eukprot:jgi/Tetstr1/438301/TSEL_026868.t1